MGIALAQVLLPNISGFAEDTCVNTFHFQTPLTVVSPVEANAIADKLANFYNVSHPGSTAPLATEISTVVARSLCSIRVYDLSMPQPRPPIHVEPFTLGPTAASSNYPNEVSLVLSYRAAPVPGIPLARLRGRVYIGPLIQAGALASGDVRPSTVTMTKLAMAGKFLATVGGTEPTWVVHSRVGGGDNAVVSGHVDNAYDTQRRRGRDAFDRVNWTILV
jgi:hypothetical protein